MFVPVESIFHSIAAPTFSELVFVLQYGQLGNIFYFPACFLDALHRMYAVRSFELRFSLVLSGTISEDSERVVRQKWEECVNAAIDGGFSTFLDRKSVV